MPEARSAWDRDPSDAVRGRLAAPGPLFRPPSWFEPRCSSRAHLPLSPTSEFSEKLAGAPSHPPRQCLTLAPVTRSGGGSPQAQRPPCTTSCRGKTSLLSAPGRCHAAPELRGAPRGSPLRGPVLKAKGAGGCGVSTAVCRLGRPRPQLAFQYTGPGDRALGLGAQRVLKRGGRRRCPRTFPAGCHDRRRTPPRSGLRSARLLHGHTHADARRTRPGHTSCRVTGQL